MKLNADFTDLLTQFADHEVEFALIGGWALAVYGHARGTDDLDVLVRATPENADRVIRRIGRTEPLFKGRPRSIPCETALLLRLTVR